MLNSTIIHPQLLAALARCGHGTKILISDGNYPHITGAPADAERVYLNFSRGLLTVSQVLSGLVPLLNCEQAEIMLDENLTERPVIADYRQQLGETVELIGHERFDFYSAAKAQDVALVIATGDDRQYANLLLTVGVRPEGAE